MTETVGWAWSAPRADKPAGPGELSAERLRAMYHALLVPRLIEERALLLLRQGKRSSDSATAFRTRLGRIPLHWTAIDAGGE